MERKIVKLFFKHLKCKTKIEQLEESEVWREGEREREGENFLRKKKLF